MHHALQIGAGRMGRNWLTEVIPIFPERLDIIGLADIDKTNLENASKLINLSSERQYTDIDTALSRTQADCCIVVTTPNSHKDAIIKAIDRGLHILTEKPLADTWEDSEMIYHKAKSSGVKVQVVQNYRYEPPNIMFHEMLNSGELGRINYIVAQFLADYRKKFSWGSMFRHEIDHALLIEGSIHHLDMLRYFSRSDCLFISGFEWNPDWSSSKGELNGLFVGEMMNGVKLLYEGSGVAAGKQAPWDNEYYRAECENGSLILDTDGQLTFVQKGLPARSIKIREFEFTGHQYVLQSFLDWLDHDKVPDTNIEDNIKSTAMLFGAIKAAKSHSVVNVRDMFSHY